MTTPNVMPVVIESPYAGKNPVHFRRNIAYLHAAIQDCLLRGEIPYASHNFFPGALDDTIPEQRKQGIEAGFRMAEVLAKAGGYRAFYTDRGTSTGMAMAVEHSEKIGMLFIPRSLGEQWRVENDPKYCDHANVAATKPGFFKLFDSKRDDASPNCPDCGAEFATVTLPQDAIDVALAWMGKKA